MGRREQPFERDQRRIENTQNSMKVLELMVQHQRRTERGTFTDGLIWSAKMIGEQIGLDIKRTNTALKCLLRRGLVEKRGREWFTTSEARDAFSEDVRSVALSLGGSDHAFRTEALTGCDELGHETKLSRAVLPFSARNYEPGNRIERETINAVLRYNHIRAVAAKLGRTIEETNEGFASGAIHQCNQCGEVRWHHRHGGKGGEFQHACTDCMRARRRRA